MLRLSIRFPGGRYHATPWGRHVNEGDVEWPPSPWRLYRALVSAGFTKLGWKHVPPDGRALLERLAGAVPAYFLPLASLGHTRHYMPQFKGSTAKVLDAFAYVGRGDDAVLGIEWDVELSPPELALFDDLATHLGYLGRAESWVTAKRVEAFPAGLSPCRPSETVPARGYERVGLLAPMDAQAYARWREESALAERQRQGAPGKASSKSAAKKAAERIDALFPKDLVAVLLADTAALQRDGWSQPPGTRWLSYWREDHVLTTSPPRRIEGVKTRGHAPTTALLAVASDTATREVLPRIQDAVLRADAIHASLVALSDKIGGRASTCFIGKDAAGEPLKGHRHAMVLPISLHHAGRIDHVLVHAPMGFDEAARGALAGLRKTWAKNLPDLYLTLVGLGWPEDFARLVPHLRASAVWTSVTPFVPPRFLKSRGRDTLEGQVHAELASRRLPRAARVEVELDGGGFRDAAEFWGLWEHQSSRCIALAPSARQKAGALLSKRWRHYRKERLGEGKKPPLATGIGLRVTFEQAVSGPIALGYGSHFGLGNLAPEG